MIAYLRLGVGIPLVLAASLPVALQAQDLRATLERYVTSHQRAIVSELVELLTIPNTAADTENIRRNAALLRDMLRRRSFASEILETDGNPLVWGELKVPGAKRTLLIWAHYDGQPVDPKGWKQASPFVPVLRAGRLEDDAKPYQDSGRSTDSIRTGGSMHGPPLMTRLQLSLSWLRLTG